MLMRVPTQWPCGCSACGIRSFRCCDFRGCKPFSRYSDSICGPLVSTTSASLRPARISVTARASTFSELARQVLSLTPYFFSNAAVSGVRSSGTSEV